MRFFIALSLWNISRLLSGVTAQSCPCFTATSMKTPTSCAAPVCQVTVTSSVPTANPACPTTPTVTGIMTCPTSRACNTVWTTQYFTPSCMTATSTSTTSTPEPTSTEIPDDACLPQPVSDNPYQVPLSPASAFIGSQSIQNAADDAITPIGYKQVFKNRLASMAADQYLGMRVIPQYDPFTCATECDNKPGCASFNIFFERDPTLDPGQYCPNPPATANIKCTYWGVMMDGTMAVNTGETRYKFRIAIAGSNGYTAYTSFGGGITVSA